MTCMYPDGSPLLISRKDWPDDALLWTTIFAEDRRRLAALESHTAAEGISMGGVSPIAAYQRANPVELGPWMKAALEQVRE